MDEGGSPVAKVRYRSGRGVMLVFEHTQDLLIFKPIFCEIFEIAAVQKDANLVELEKCCQTHIFLQKFVLIHPRTSPPKINPNPEPCRA